MRNRLPPKLSRREQQDLMDKAVLRNLARVDYARWTELEKRVLRINEEFVSSHRFRLRVKYLLERGLIEKINKGVYRITDAGRKYLEVLKMIYEK